MTSKPFGFLYFEDLEEGAIYWGDECLVDRAEMIDFAHKNDPLPMHIDEQAALRSPYGALIASGAFTISVWYRSTIPIALRLATLGGLEWRIKLPRPVHAGDRLRTKWAIVSKRLSSKPGRGVVTTMQELLNDQGDPVLICEGVILVATRPL
jgi:acyl dehydratase